jgi:plasmid stabilization system protein ParE
MMGGYRVIVTPRAGSDLEAIHDHIAADSPRNVGTVIARILDAVERLKQVPHRTIVEQATVPGQSAIRSLVVVGYIVYFRVRDDNMAVHIVHVRHGARRPPTGLE